MVTTYLATGVSVAIGTFNGFLDNVNIGGASADMVDMTHQASANDWREKKSALKDGGQVTLTVHYDPDATDPPVVGETATDMTITWGPTPNPDKSYRATCLVQNVSIVANLGEKIVSDITLEVTGAPNFAYDATP